MARLALLTLALSVVLALVFKNDIYAQLKSQEFAASQAKNELLSETYLNRILISDGNFNPEAKSAVWFDRLVPLPTNVLAQTLATSPEKVLGETNEEKWIEIDLSTQTLYAKEGARTVYTFPVSSGLPWFPTVTGEFRIWAKILSQEMIGGSKADGTYYDLPNVPFVQYFYNGYGLHGTYWHSDFGKPRSHGCINLSIENAKTLYYWTNPAVPSGQNVFVNIPPDKSTRVVIHGTTPTSL